MVYQYFILLQHICTWFSNTSVPDHFLFSIYNKSVHFTTKQDMQLCFSPQTRKWSVISLCWPSSKMSTLAFSPPKWPSTSLFDDILIWQTRDRDSKHQHRNSLNNIHSDQHVEVKALHICLTIQRWCFAILRPLFTQSFMLVDLVMYRQLLN